MSAQDSPFNIVYYANSFSQNEEFSVKNLRLHRHFEKSGKRSYENVFAGQMLCDAFGIKWEFWKIYKKRGELDVEGKREREGGQNRRLTF